MRFKNLITYADSYKFSHFLQYPDGIEFASSYVEARTGGRWPSTIFFGLQGALQSYFSDPITDKDIDFAESLASCHGVPFNRFGWEGIIDDYGGILPLLIEAVPEGTNVSNGNVLAQITNTDPDYAWLVSYFETVILQSIWYPTTVCTNSKICQNIVMDGLTVTGCKDPKAVANFQVHDFGFRGASSRESAAIGGAAHLVNFSGTDTVAALEYVKAYYSKGLPNTYIPGFSIPASEHSTISSWGAENEDAAFENMLDAFLVPGSIVACVSDTYDLMNACKTWGTKFKDRIMNSGGRLVVRPDSGDPVENSLATVEALATYFGYTVNTVGYKVLPDCIRVIYGDGINSESIFDILLNLQFNGYAAENINFGMGGALLQGVDRDTLRFACKMSEVTVEGETYSVHKSPVTDQTKHSKEGRLALIKENGIIKTVRKAELGERDNLLEPVWQNGKLLRYQNFEEIRKIAAAI